MNFKDYKEELMKDPEFAKAYEELRPEMEAIRAALNAPEPRAYPMEGKNLDPSLLLVDPPARTPVADRRTAVIIYPDGKVYLSTNDPTVVRPIAKAISQGKESWTPLVIEGDKGHQTRWELKGDSSLISIRASKFKRPGVIKNLKKKRVGE